MKKLMYLLAVLVYSYAHAQTNNETTIAKAKALINDYRFSEAMRELQGCDTRQCLTELGYCYSKTGDFKKSDYYYSKVLALDSTDRTALFQVGYNAENTGNYKKAKVFYHKLLKSDSTNAAYFKLLGIIYTKLDNDSLAMVFMRKSLAFNPTDLDGIHELGKIYFRRNMLFNCRNLIERYLKLDTTYLPLHQLKVRALYKDMRYQDVVPAIHSLMALGDSSLALQRMLGFSYYRIDSTSQCIKALEKYAQKSEPEEGVHYFLGLAYLKINNTAKAKTHFEKAVALGVSENIADYYYTLGYINENEKNYKEAIEAYNNAYLFDNRPYLLFLLARTYDWKNDKSKAVEYYNRYLNSADSVKQFRADATKRLQYLKDQ